MRYCHTLTRMTEMENTENAKCWPRVEIIETTLLVGINIGVATLENSKFKKQAKPNEIQEYIGSENKKKKKDMVSFGVGK